MAVFFFFFFLFFFFLFLFFFFLFLFFFFLFLFFFCSDVCVCVWSAKKYSTMSNTDIQILYQTCCVAKGQVQVQVQVRI